MASARKALVYTIPRFLSSNTRISSVDTQSSIHRPKLSYLSRYYSSSSSNGSTQIIDVDLSNEESKRRLFNKLLYRSKQRGFLELDLILGKWVEDHIHSMDENGIRSLAQVLDLENPDLWKWMSGQEQPPEELIKNPVFVAVKQKVTTNLDKHAAPETRANPGQSWVRGWDDFKKGRDAPVAGNQ